MTYDANNNHYEEWAYNIFFGLGLMLAWQRKNWFTYEGAMYKLLKVRSSLFCAYRPTIFEICCQHVQLGDYKWAELREKKRKNEIRDFYFSFSYYSGKCRNHINSTHSFNSHVCESGVVWCNLIFRFFIFVEKSFADKN